MNKTTLHVPKGFPEEPEFNYPLDEIMHIMEELQFSMMDSSFDNKLSNILVNFENRVLNKFNIPSEERSNFGLTWQHSSENKIAIKCKNLFTACIMFGHYMPYIFVEGLNKFTLKDGSTIEYLHESGGYVLNNVVRVGGCKCENNDACTREEMGSGEWEDYCWKCKDVRK